ncbi:MAG TPA: hypothetical protein VGH02_12175 [Rhizomicrobium sp.]|jgi:hypothetical protein
MPTTEVNFAALFPDSFVLTIKDIDRILDGVLPGRVGVRIPFELNSRSLSRDFIYQFARTRPAISTTFAPHDIRRIAVEALIATEISRRLAIFFDDLVRAALKPELATEVSRPAPFYNPRGGVDGNRDYFRRLLDLTIDPWGDIPANCAFDIYEISLASPSKFSNRIKKVLGGVVLGVGLIGAPVNVEIIKRGIEIVETAINGADLCYKITLCAEPATASPSAAAERHLENLSEEIANNKYVNVKLDLFLLGFYDGPMNNSDGALLRRSMQAFLISKNLPEDLLPNNPTALRALARAAMPMRQQP